MICFHEGEADQTDMDRYISEGIKELRSKRGIHVRHIAYAGTGRNPVKEVQADTLQISSQHIRSWIDSNQVVGLVSGNTAICTWKHNTQHETGPEDLSRATSGNTQEMSCNTRKRIGVNR